VDFLTLLQQSLAMTAIDIDNATYTTGAINAVPANKQQRIIFWSTVVEFLGRLLLALLFLFVFSGSKPLFVLFGIEFSAETISLFAAGIFLLISNGRELVHFLQQAGEPDAAHALKPMPLSRLVAEMGLVLTVMSVDTVIAGLGIAANLPTLLFFFVFSAIIRLVFVQQIAKFVRQYPAVNLVIFSLLALIGLELIGQGLGIDFEIPFNLGVVLAIVAAITVHWQHTKRRLLR
jgi:predicted tellurium resistance membrane protein TerC